MNSMKTSTGWKTRAVALAIGLLACASAVADSSLSLVKSFAGNINFVGTQKTYRTKSNSQDPCAIKSANNNVSNTLSGIPTGATVTAAYLYWVASGATPDYTVTFEGATVTASRQYTATSNGKYFGGVADVTAAVASKRNGTYSFSGLTIDNTTDCSVAAVVGGWALLVVYSNSTEAFRVLNVYEGLKPIQNNSATPETITVSNFQVPSSGSLTGRVGLLVWEGDSDLNSTAEKLIFNGTALTDSLNPVGNLFSSTSNINNDSLSYGIDYDAFTVTMTAGQTSATTTASTGQDFVLLNMEVLAVPNVPVDDLQITNSSSSAFSRGNIVSYTLGVSNNGPNSETGVITVVDTLPAGLTGGTASGSGWSCGTSGQTITCTNPNASGLAKNASTNAITVTATVSNTATGTITNSATVSGTVFDNVSSNNTATKSNSVQTVDLALTMTRTNTLVPNQNASYTLSVSNGGQVSEPGNITVVDTLPSDLSFVSGGGGSSGWTCSVSGQVVTCVRTGALAAGASANSLIITVAVSSTANGAELNSATVSGTGYETVVTNNSASDTYTITTTLYAYYKLDETTAYSHSAGEVKDSSGNNRHGVTVGTVTSVVSSNPTPTCRAATIGSNTSAANQYAVSVPVQPQDLKQSNIPSGTIAFWWKSANKWNDNGAHMLFDATADSVGDYAFYVMKSTGNALAFALTDSGNVTLTATTSTTFSYAASTWHHIAIAWKLVSGTGTTMQIYVDGVAVSSTIAYSSGSTATGAWPTGTNANGNLYFGDTHSASVKPYLGTSASADGDMDEIYIYPGVMTSTEVGQLYTASHTCTALHHYELSLPSNSINCAPSIVTVTACADSSLPCTNKYVGVVGTTATLTVPVGTATLGNTAVTPAVTSATVTFNDTGVATSAVSYPTAAVNGVATVTLSGEQTIAPNPRYCCLDGVTCGSASSNSCSTTFSPTGLIFARTANGASANIPKQTAGTSSGNLYLRAVKSSVDSTMACQSAFGSGDHTVSFAHTCVDPDTCSAATNMAINGGSSSTIIRGFDTKNTPNPSLVYTDVTMHFDGSGNAPFTLNYNDVGQVTLYASTIANLATVTGQSAPFIVRPGGFKVTAIKQSDGTLYDSTDSKQKDPSTAIKFAKAGVPFYLEVSAVTSDGSTVTKNFGKESTKESVSFAPPGPGLDASGNPFVEMVDLPALNGTFDTLSNGVLSGSAFSWDEVGIIQLTPSLASNNYLGTGDGKNGTTSNNIGRFIPDHYGVDSPTVVNRSELTCPIASNFSYMNEPFTSSFNLFAQNKSGAVITKNYTGRFVRLAPTDWLTTSGSNGALGLRMAATSDVDNGLGCTTVAFDATSPDNGSAFNTIKCNNLQHNSLFDAVAARVKVTTAPVFSWSDGNSAMSVTVKLARGPVHDGPYGGEQNSTAALNVGIAPVDTDGVTGANFGLDTDLDGTNDRLLIGSTGMRYGQMRIPNVYGSEKLDMPLVLTSQYWSTKNNRWMTSWDDNCTPWENANFAIVQSSPSLAQAGTLPATTSVTGSSTLVAGNSVNLRLAKPLDSNGNAITQKYSFKMSTSTTKPQAQPLNDYLPGIGTLTFGVYKAGPVIFIRESY
jgi:uncharacterized repeat protein (TIGR01451 family)